MGRPLNKKYFGNRNIGTASTDTGIGGEGVLSAAVSGPVAGYTTRPTITFTAPTTPTGISATATILSKAKSATINGTQTRAYPVGTGTIVYSTSTWTPTITTGALGSVIYSSATAISFSTTTTAMLPGTSIAISGASITGTMTIGGTALTAGQIYYAGGTITATATSLYPTYADALAGTNQLTISNGTTTGATFTHGATFGTVTAVTVNTVGSFTTLASGAQNVTSTVGAGLQIVVTYEALGTTITNKGSGYVTAPTQLGGTFNGTLGTITLTADSGAPGSSTNQENAIVAYAWIGGAGGSRQLVDIVKQEASRRYAVKTASLVSGEPWTVRSAILVPREAAADTDGDNTYNEMDITATDSAGNAYWVTKLTAHKALLTRKVGGSGLYATGESAPWKFDAAAGIYVKIDNA